MFQKAVLGAVTEELGPRCGLESGGFESRCERTKLTYEACFQAVRQIYDHIIVYVYIPALYCLSYYILL